MKGLPSEFQSFVVVITQSDKDYTFQEFKVQLRSFEETEKARNGSSGDVVMKARHGQPQQGGNNKGGGDKTIQCFKCGEFGHKFDKCTDTNSKWCSHCKSNTHAEKACRKLAKQKRDRANKASSSNNNNTKPAAKHSYSFFKASDATPEEMRDFQQSVSRDLANLFVSAVRPANSPPPAEHRLC